MKEKKKKGKNRGRKSQRAHRNLKTIISNRMNNSSKWSRISPALWVYQNTDPHSQCFVVSCPARCFQPPTISSTLVRNSKIIFYVCYNVKKGCKAPIEYTTVVTMSALRYILSKKNLKNNRCNCISYAVVVIV